MLKCLTSGVTSMRFGHPSDWVESIREASETRRSYFDEALQLTSRIKKEARINSEYKPTRRLRIRKEGISLY